jgi:lipopolysaccharide/colanic/teichoic acid biosynthesis glycosyltransferase
MISDREKKLYHLYVGLVSLGMLVYVCASYGLMYWLRPGLDPAVFSYARFALISMLSLLIEGWTRNAEWRATPGRGVSRFRWYVTQRQWLWLSVSLGLILFFARDTQISRGYIFFVVLTAVPLLYASNRWGFPIFVRTLVRRSPDWKVCYSLIGSDEWRQSVRDRMHSVGDMLEQGAEYPIGAETTLEEVVAWVERQPIDLLVVPARQIPDAWVTRLLAMGERRGFRCWIPLEFSRQFGWQFNLQSVGGLNVLTPPSNPLGEIFNRMMKRVFDIGLSLAIVSTVLLPLMVVVWCIHRLYAPGPLFFRQDRLGENGKIFKVIKFRTMHLHNECEGLQATDSDPRIFKFGKLLRKLSVDEFPQFLNVLWGDMSVVGPRPHLEIHERRFEVFYERYGMRRFVKPGVTGLAQIRGYRGEVRTSRDVRGRGRYDLIYVRNWSLSLDIKIVLQTGIQVLRPHRNAY